MAIALNANEMLTCTCICPQCGAGRPAYKNRSWRLSGPANPTHCQNQKSGCGFSTGQESSYQVY